MVNKIIQNLKLVFFASQENNFKARLLDGDFLFRVVSVFFVLRIIVLPFYVHFPKSIFFAKITSSEIFDLLNEQRKSEGLSILKEDPKLTQAAFLKAQDMFEHDYFGHKSPSGIPGWYWIEQSNYNYEGAGENLAIGFLDSGEVYRAWNNSSLHKSNLLSPYFQDVGIAVLAGEFQGNETTIVVQLFSKPEARLAEKVLPPAEAKVEEIEEIPGPEETPMEEKVSEKEIPEEIAPRVAIAPEVIPEVAPGVTPKKEEPSFQSMFWEFLAKRYGGLVQKAIFIAVCLITLVFILNIIAIVSLALPLEKKKVLLRKLVPASFLAIIFLVLLGLLDKSLLVQAIPHRLEI